VTAVQSLALGLRGHPQCEPAWQLSNLYLHRHFGRVEIWADPTGEQWLRGIGIQAHEWHRLPEIPEELAPVWSVGKILAAGAQRGPFLHVDGDVFLRQPPPSAPFLVQHAEIDKPAAQWWDRAGFAPMPRPPGMLSLNFGIFGGTRWEEITWAARQVFQCLLAHRALVAGCRCPWLPMLVEQVWIPALLAAQGIAHTPLLRHDHLQADAARLGYCHAMSGKRRPEFVAKIAERLAAERAELVPPDVSGGGTCPAGCPRRRI
jgi:hypothetical protein